MFISVLEVYKSFFNHRAVVLSTRHWHGDWLRAGCRRKYQFNAKTTHTELPSWYLFRQHEEDHVKVDRVMLIILFNRVVLHCVHGNVFEEDKI